MKAFREYWTFSAIRGVLTVVVAAGMILLPYLAIAIVKIPFTLMLAVDLLGAYLLMDAGANVLLALMLPASADHRNARYVQAGMAILFGATCYVFTYGEILPQGMLMYALAAQAAIAAVLEYRVAEDTYAQYGESFCYSTAAVAAVCALGVAAAGSWDEQAQLAALVLYVSAYGCSQALLGGRMLFGEYRSERSAVLVGQAPVVAAVATTPVVAKPVVATPAAAFASCDTCVAAAVSCDGSVAVQVRQVLATARPRIVQAARIASVVRPAGVYREGVR